jgi:hypothetical protein
MGNVYWTCGFILLGIAFYRYGLPALRRFDRANVARIAREERDKAEPNAHIRHALDVADQQIEEVQEIKAGSVIHYLFEAQVFSSRQEAEEMRAHRVGLVARRFYEELPAALAGAPERGRMSARERASQRWRRTFH